MAIACVACFLVVLQVVSSAHVTSPRTMETTTLQETTLGDTTTPTFPTTMDNMETTPETNSPSFNFTITDSTESTTDDASNATASTTDSTIVVNSELYVTVTDEPTTETAKTTAPPPNMAVLSQPGLLSLLSVAFGLVSQLRWCR